MAFWIWNILSFYVIDLLIFVFCYGRILMVIRRQARVMAAHSAATTAGLNTAQTQWKAIQTNVIKTMLLVSVLFAITMAPANVVAFLIHVADVRPSTNTVYVALFLAYVYMCFSPFIYATKYDPVKRVLVRLIPCNKTAEALE